jgi:predicted nucleotidyltransferase
MVKTKVELNELAEELARRLEARGTPVERILIWGKYATGNASADSDIRLIVISPALNSRDMESGDALANIAFDLDVQVQAWGFSPEELRDARGGPLYSPFLSMIVGEAQEVYPTRLKSHSRVAARNA